MGFVLCNVITAAFWALVLGLKLAASAEETRPRTVVSDLV